MARRLSAVLFVLTAAALLAGCATTPTFTPVAAGPGARIGIANLLTSTGVRNVHVGYTVFGNYDDDLGSDWRLDQRALDDTRKLLRDGGYELVDVTLDPAQVEAIRKRDDQTNLNYSGLTSEWTQNYERIMADHRLSALVVLREEVRYMGEHGPVLTGYGISSVLGRVPSNAFLFVTATADVIGGRPPHRSIGTCYGAEPLDTALIHVDNFADIKLADLDPIRTKFESLLDRRIRFELASSGLLAEQVACVPPTYPHHASSRKLQ